MELTTCDIVEMLKADLAHEKQAACDYEALAALAPGEEESRHILNIRRQELIHYEILEEILSDITGREYTPPACRANDYASWSEGLKSCICRELKAAEGYAELSCCLLCMRHKEKSVGILNDEKCHARILYKLYEESL